MLDFAWPKKPSKAVSDTHTALCLLSLIRQMLSVDHAALFCSYMMTTPDAYVLSLVCCRCDIWHCIICNKIWPWKWGQGHMTVASASHSPSSTFAEVSNFLQQWHNSHSNGKLLRCAVVPFGNQLHNSCSLSVWHHLLGNCLTEYLFVNIRHRWWLWIERNSIESIWYNLNLVT